MALYSGARQRDLGKDTRPLDATDLVCCLHTMVGSLYGVDQYFRTVGTFSHFGIGGKWGGDATRGLDGVTYQWGDTALRSAANLNGNRRVISIETADNAARPIEPWTTRQQTAIVNLLVWVHRTHGVPLVLIGDSKPGRRGIAYHRMGCDPYRVDGGELWSNSVGKDCPTQARINQIPALIQRARDIVNGTTPTPEDDMFESADRNLLTHVDDMLARNNVVGKVNDLTDDMAEVKTTLADLTAAVKALTPTPPPAG